MAAPRGGVVAFPLSMPLFIVRPSRGAWAFFGLVVLSAAAARGVDHREHTIARRDGPVAGVALDLARCVYGEDTAHLLDDTSVTDRPSVWALRMADWLRIAATTPQAPDWPGRCAAQADHLAARLEATPAAPQHAVSLARTVAGELRAVTGDPMAFLNAADADGLADRMATLLAQVRAMSSGAVGRWDHDAPMPPAARGEARLVRVARLLPLARDAERAVLTSPSMVMYRAGADGTVHVLDFDPAGRRDVTVGPGAPLRESVAGDMARFEGDDGPSLLVPDPSPRAVPLPEALARGVESLDTWDAARTVDRLALLTGHMGSLVLRTTPRDGPVQWSAPVSVGPSESTLAGVLCPTGPTGPGDPAGFRVTVLRPRVDDALLEQYLVTPTAEASPVTPSPAKPSVLAPVPAPPPGAAWRVEPPETLLTGVPALGARVTACAAGDVRYLTVASDAVLSVIRIRGGTVRMAQAPGVQVHGREPVVSCDDTRVVVSTGSAGRGGWQAFAFFDHDTPTVTPLDPPLTGPVGRVEAMALLRGETLAVVSSRSTLRTFVQPAHGGAWRSAGLVAQLTPAPGPLRTITRVTARGSGRQLALLVEGTAAPRPPPARPHDDAVPDTTDDTAERQPPPVPFVSLLVSSDGGRTFSSP